MYMKILLCVFSGYVCLFIFFLIKFYFDFVLNILLDFLLDLGDEVCFFCGIFMFLIKI